MQQPSECHLLIPFIYLYLYIVTLLYQKHLYSHSMRMILLFDTWYTRHAERIRERENIKNMESNMEYIIIFIYKYIFPWFIIIRQLIKCEDTAIEASASMCKVVSQRPPVKAHWCKPMIARLGSNQTWLVTFSHFITMDNNRYQWIWIQVWSKILWKNSPSKASWESTI